jgi:hypothetical protein
MKTVQTDIDINLANATSNVEKEKPSSDDLIQKTTSETLNIEALESKAQKEF